MSTSEGRDATIAAGDGDNGPVRVDLTRSDERVLAYLAGCGADYPALIAGNTGLHVGYVERRIEAMADAGLVEAESGEVIHRITAAGRDALHGR